VSRGPAAAKLALVICGALVLLGALGPGIAEADSGGLDPAFGDGGLVSSSLDLAPKRGHVELGVSVDGFTVVGESAGFMVRFGEDGSLDAGFGEGGKLFLKQGAVKGLGEGDGRSFLARRAAVDSQGRLLIFGQEVDTRRSVNSGTITGESAPASWAVVLRLTPQGKPDLTFGGGKGFARSGFGLRSRFSSRFPMTSALAGGVDSHDRPVLVAGVTTVFGGCYSKGGQLTMYPRGVVRLTATGRTDDSFGGGAGSQQSRARLLFPHSVSTVAIVLSSASAVLSTPNRNVGVAPL